MSEPQTPWWPRARQWIAKNLTLDGGAAVRLARDQAVVVEAQRARIASLTASLEDTHREVSRLTGEKHARDQVIHEIAEKAASLHRQEAGK